MPPLEGLGNYVDISAVANGWQAMVVVALIFAVMIWPGIVSLLNRRTMKRVEETQARVEKTLTENNGGSSVKDALDSIKKVQAEHGKTLTDHITWSEGYRKATEDRLANVEAKAKKRGLFGR